MIPRNVVDIFVDEVQPDGVRVQVGPDHPRLLVTIVAGGRGEDGGAASLHRDLANCPRLDHLEGNPDHAFVGHLGPPHPGVPPEPATLRVGQVLDLARIDPAIALAQRHAVSNPAPMIEPAHPHQVNADPVLVAPRVTLQLLVPVGIYDQVPIETAEREIIGLQFVRLRLARRECAARHLKVGHVHGPHVGHRQFQLELAVRVGEVSAVQVRDRDVVPVALGRRLVRELDPFPGESLVHGEVFPVQKGEREVHVDAQVPRRTAPHQVRA